MRRGISSNYPTIGIFRDVSPFCAFRRQTSGSNYGTNMNNTANIESNRGKSQALISNHENIAVRWKKMSSRPFWA